MDDGWKVKAGGGGLGWGEGPEAEPSRGTGMREPDLLSALLELTAIYVKMNRVARNTV